MHTSMSGSSVLVSFIVVIIGSVSLTVTVIRQGLLCLFTLAPERVLSCRRIRLESIETFKSRSPTPVNNNVLGRFQVKLRLHSPEGCQQKRARQKSLRPTHIKAVLSRCEDISY
jgi:hypothetical protein